MADEDVAADVAAVADRLRCLRFQTRDSKRNSRVVSAPVGQMSVTQALIQLSSGTPGKTATSVDAPRLKNASSFVFVISAQNRMQRVQWMQRFMFCTT